MKGGDGEDSSKVRLVGRRGADNILDVPTGIVIVDQEENKIIGELNEKDEKVLVAGGGELNKFHRSQFLKFNLTRRRRM